MRFGKACMKQVGSKLWRRVVKVGELTLGGSVSIGPIHPTTHPVERERMVPVTIWVASVMGGRTSDFRTDSNIYKQFRKNADLKRH